LKALEKIRVDRDTDDEFLMSTDIDELLKVSDDTSDNCSPRDTVFGYPTRPLYQHLAWMLQLWLDSG